MSTKNSDPQSPSLCVISARLKQTRSRSIKALAGFDKADYSALERELIACLKQNYDVKHFSDTDASEWPLSYSPSFPARMFARGHSPISSSKSVDSLSNSFSFGKDLELLQQFMQDNVQTERFVVNLFARVRLII